MTEKSSEAQLPVLLMATSSVLIDATFRRELYRDRIWAQLILWLGVSLQQPSSPLTHGVFACSILSCACMTLSLRWTWWSGGPDYTRLLAPSMLLALLYEYCQSWLGFVSAPWLVFLMTFASLFAWRWYSHQRYQRRQSLVGMPVVSSTVNLHGMNLDESQWSHWTRSEVLQWIASLDNDWRSTVCCHLALEGITGSVLKAMTREDLRSMGISYGDAHRLYQQMQLLASKYPDHNERNYGAQPQQQEQFGDWYRSDSSPFNFEEAMAPRAPKSFMNESEGLLSEEVAQKAKDLMKERFGFELPDFKLTRDDEAPHDTARAKSNTTTAQPQSSAEAFAATGEVPEDVGADGPFPTAKGLPADLLAAMPDHVREVAMRKPELVKELLMAQQLQGKAPPDQDRIRRLVQSAMPPKPVETTMPNDSSDDERETTSLLRKRAKDPKYASIR